MKLCLLVLIFMGSIFMGSNVIYAQGLAKSFDEAKKLATQTSATPNNQQLEEDVLRPHFTAKVMPLLDTCFAALDEPDDAKFEVVLALEGSGKVEKVYRSLETNLGSCLFAELEQITFPLPTSAPSYFHALLDKLAGNFTCPYDTILNEETKPQLSVSWCEVVINGQTVFHGPYRAWWPNGRLGNEAHYEYGVPVGLWRGWYESGRLQGSNLYEDGVVVHKERYPDE